MERAERECMKFFADNPVLGALTEAPRPVTGGLLHKMYRVSTTQGIYGVKVLNPEVMKRPEAMGNMIRSEKIAAALGQIIPAVSALEIGGSRIHRSERNYCMVFPWIDGRSVFPGEIGPDHCRVIGEILGKIHGCSLKMEDVLPESGAFRRFPWEWYARKAAEKEDESGVNNGGGSEKEKAKGTDSGLWKSAYGNALEDIRKWNKDAWGAESCLSGFTVISHRDLDPKNVMWDRHASAVSARVIDWEAAGCVNPFQELLEVAAYWADDGKGGLIPENLEALLTSYGRYMELCNAHWDTIIRGSCMGMLGWLEYNLRRALGMEAAEEILSGQRQVVETIRELYACRKKFRQVAAAIQKTEETGPKAEGD